MASYHCSLKAGKKGNTPLHALYICREGKYRSSKKEDLEYKEHCNMPTWARNNPHEFWKAAEEYERANGRTYMEIEVALPNELNPEQRLELVQDFIKEQIGENHPYTVAIHCPKAALKRNVDQPHAHIMFSERQLDQIERNSELFFARANKKNPELGGAFKDTRFSGSTGKKNVEKLRASWAEHQNRVLEKYGHEVRVDYRSLQAQRYEALEKGDFKKAEQLDRPPEIHLGPKMVQRTSRLVRRQLENARTPQEREQKRYEYYEKKEPNRKVRNVFYLREYKRTNEAIEKELRQIDEKSPSKYTVRIREINNTLTRLLHERRELTRKVITPERAELIAQSIYTKGAIKRAAEERHLLVKELNAYNRAIQKHQIEVKPGPMDLSLRKVYNDESKRLEAWNSNLNAKEAANKDLTEGLKASMETPEARTQLERIKEAVLKKNEPQREQLKNLDNQINALRIERGELSQQRVKMTVEKTKIPRSQRNRARENEIKKLERSVKRLEQENINKAGLKARILDNERNKEWDPER